MAGSRAVLVTSPSWWARLRCEFSAWLSLEPGRKESQQFQNVVPDIFGLEASELASLGAKRFHDKPPLIGLGVHRRSGGGRVQAFAIIRFLFGRALRPLQHSQQLRLVGLKPGQQTIEHDKAGSTLKNAIKPRPQFAPSPRGRLSSVSLEVTVEPPDQRSQVL